MTCRPARSGDQRSNREGAAAREGADPRLATTIGGAIAEIACHPVHHLILRWNWKSALLSLMLRMSIFITVNLTASLDSALDAAATELMFRAPMVGTLASVSQSLRRVRPAWLASLMVMVALPAVAHSIEFLVHWSRGTEKLAASVAVSIGFSMLTTVLNYQLQRRGVLVVGTGSRSFLTDLGLAPLALFDLAVRSPLRFVRSALAGPSPGTKDR